MKHAATPSTNATTALRVQAERHALTESIVAKSNADAMYPAKITP